MACTISTMYVLLQVDKNVFQNEFSISFTSFQLYPIDIYTVVFAVYFMCSQYCMIIFLPLINSLLDCVSGDITEFHDHPEGLPDQLLGIVGRPRKT
jgi:hypothetical protein